jgi:hypothetical protein
MRSIVFLECREIVLPGDRGRAQVDGGQEVWNGVSGVCKVVEVRGLRVIPIIRGTLDG